MSLCKNCLLRAGLSMWESLSEKLCFFLAVQGIWAKWGGNAASASKKSRGTELGTGVIREGCAGRNCREYSFSYSSWNTFCFSHVTVNLNLQHLSPGFKNQRCGQSVQSVQTSTNAADCKKSWKMLKQAVRVVFVPCQIVSVLTQLG